jgi:hypothetical protein
MNGAFQQAIAVLQRQVAAERLSEVDPQVIRLGKTGIQTKRLSDDFVETQLIGQQPAVRKAT